MTTDTYQTAISINRSWPVFSLTGLTIDSLGRYLAALGLLSISTKKWPSIRGCWRDEHFVLVNGPSDIGDLADFLDDVAANKAWTKYEKTWAKALKVEPKRRSRECALWRARDANESEVTIFDSHLAVGDRLIFNPIFGTGGNSGKRNFAKGWEEATGYLEQPGKNRTREDLRGDLISFFEGRPCLYLGNYNAACWFSEANKMYNSGTAKPYRDGQVTPWAMALACEAFSMLRGATSRRLGRGNRSMASFPFVVAPSAAETSGATGIRIGEAWLPCWSRPMSAPEVLAMFSRGRAEVRGRGAITATAFATAIIQRGVDAGITEFRRFMLLHTTSEKTFESHLENIVPVQNGYNESAAQAIGAILEYRDGLPRDYKKGKRWIYGGLRGPIDRGLIEYASRPDAASARMLIDPMITTLKAVDSNSSYRKKNLRFRLLPAGWSMSLLDEHEYVTPEIRMALAISSLIPTWAGQGGLQKQVTAPLFLYWLGAETHSPQYWVIPEKVSHRRVWNGTVNLPDNLVAVLQRRLLEERPDAPPPLTYRLGVGPTDICRWLEGEVDEDEIAKWLFRFSLFDWDAHSLRGWQRRLTTSGQVELAFGRMSLFGFFKPLFDSTLIRSVGASRLVRVATLQRIVNQLWSDQLNLAIETAGQAYRAVGIQLAEVRVPTLTHGRRLLAALMIPGNITEMKALFEHWQAPTRNTK